MATCEMKPERERKSRAKAPTKKKIPQRGMGVAQLERLRVRQERLKQMSHLSDQFHFQNSLLVFHGTTSSSGGFLSIEHGSLVQRIGEGSVSGPFLVDPTKVWANMGNVVETTPIELFSTPNLLQCTPHDRREKKFNREDMEGHKYTAPSAIRGCDFLGFSQEINQSYKLGAGAAVSPMLNTKTSHNLSKGMEYEFYPVERGGRSPNPKEMELPVGASAVDGHNASDECLDLSLKL